MRGLWLLVTVMLLLFIGLAAGCIAIFQAHDWRLLLAAFAGFLIICFLAELVTGVILYTHAKFVPEHRDRAA